MATFIELHGQITIANVTSWQNAIVKIDLEEAEKLFSAVEDFRRNKRVTSGSSADADTRERLTGKRK